MGLEDYAVMSWTHKNRVYAEADQDIIHFNEGMLKDIKKYAESILVWLVHRAIPKFADSTVRETQRKYWEPQVNSVFQANGRPEEADIFRLLVDAAWDVYVDVDLGQKRHESYNGLQAAKQEQRIKRADNHMSLESLEGSLLEGTKEVFNMRRDEVDKIPLADHTAEIEALRLKYQKERELRNGKGQ